ncbi:MAG: HesB/IscA family protein [Actinomycetota bacterium]
METSVTPVFTVTEAAAQKARELAERAGLVDSYLRVRVTAGGCSGFSYRLSFDETPADDDMVIEDHGFRFLVDPRSAPIIEGSTLEFRDQMLGGGFKMENPRAVHECACGESFSI